MPPVKILVADDSTFLRRLVVRLLEATGDFTVIDTAADGAEAVKKICGLKPEAVSLDLEMPVQDGLSVLRQIMRRCPTPVVMLSSHTTKGARATMQALSLGAVDFVAKPEKPGLLDVMVAELALKLKTAALVSAHRLMFSSPVPEAVPAGNKGLPDERAKSVRPAPERGRVELIVVGSSTGGPAALQKLIPALPAHFPAAVVVVQHLPPGFSASLAEHLNRHSRLKVRHAEAGEPVAPGQVLVAPAGCELVFRGRAGGVSVGLESCGEARAPGAFRPSVDGVMLSAAGLYGARSMGVLLTGMGKDGAKGMAAIRERGGPTIAEDESTCVIFGMPKAAIETGAAQKVLPLGEIAGEIVKMV